MILVQEHPGTVVPLTAPRGAGRGPPCSEGALLRCSPKWEGGGGEAQLEMHGARGQEWTFHQLCGIGSGALALSHAQSSASSLVRNILIDAASL